MNKGDICLEDLCGEHLFSGCELTTEHMQIPWFCKYEECNVCLFTLDGVTYKAVEDPDDGYRSYGEYLEISERKPRYSFPPVKVVCSMRGLEYADGSIGNEILVIRDAENGKTILEVGTDFSEEFYPLCVFAYTPENMSCNESKA